MNKNQEQLTCGNSKALEQKASRPPHYYCDEIVAYSHVSLQQKSDRAQRTAACIFKLALR